MTDTTTTTASTVPDPIWWHKAVTDLLSPRSICAFLAICALWSMGWWMLNGRVPDQMQALFGVALTAIAQLCVAAGNWMWGKSNSEAMKDKTISDLVAKTPPTETTTTTTTASGTGA